MARLYWNLFLALMVGALFFSFRLLHIRTKNFGRRQLASFFDYAPIGVVNNTTPTVKDQTYPYSSFPQFLNSSIDCRSILEGNEQAISFASHVMKKTSYLFPTDRSLYLEAQDCSRFLAIHGHDAHTSSDEERSFPIAYSILLYKDVAQMNVLLKAIYRPQNIYCLHVDGSSDNQTKEGAKAIADCFKNVFLVSKAEDVVYAGFTRLQADLNCMKDLLASDVKWKYFINLPSQEYPLKTNEEIVKILKLYNGSNDIEGITGGRMLHARFIYRHKYIVEGGHIAIRNTGKKNPPPPHNITVIKGSAYGVFSRKFVDFILNDQRSKDLLDWCRGVLSPDEYYWATLHHNKILLNTPGGYSGKPDDKPWLATYANWGDASCSGRRMRGICVFSTGDLSYLIRKKELFANKFVMPEDPIAMMCMEQWLHNKTISSLPFDSYYYSNLPFINH